MRIPVALAAIGSEGFTPPMVLLVATTAYLVGLQPALLVALLGWAFGCIRHLFATDRDRRLQAFRDNWSRRFHRDLFATGRRNRSPLSPRA